MPILEWLGITSPPTRAPEADGLAAIERQLDTLDPPRARFVASFAYLLGRVARADQRVTPAETATMERLVAEHGGLSQADAALAVRIATAHGLRHGGTEDFLVARAFRDAASDTERMGLLDCLFAVSGSDQAIETREDNEIRRIATELQISHEDFITARARHARHLSARRVRDE